MAVELSRSAFSVDVKVRVVVSEVLRVNQDSSFLECFLQLLKLADAKHALTDAHRNARTKLPSERKRERDRWSKWQHDVSQSTSRRQ